MTMTKKQLLWHLKDLQSRDKAWVKDYNKLQKKLDKAELEIYNLKNDICELEYNSNKYKEERDINANDIEHIKQTKDHMELQYLKDVTRLQDKVINYAEHKATFVPPVYNSEYVVNGQDSHTTSGTTMTVMK